MPYVNPVIDPSKPTDTDLASQGDDEIRGLKLDLKQRLETFFTSIDADPLTVKEGAINIPGTGATISRGTIAERPNPPESDFYWATDEDKLYVNESNTWVVVSADVEGPGPISNVSFTQMKGVRISHQVQMLAVPVTSAGQPGTAFRHMFAGAAGLTLNHALIAFKYRHVDLPMPPGLPQSYAQHTSYLTTTLPLLVMWGHVGGNNTTMVVSYYGIILDGSEIKIEVIGYIHNATASPKDIYIDYDIFALAAS
jgi:hypothetical protein